MSGDAVVPTQWPLDAVRKVGRFHDTYFPGSADGAPLAAQAASPGFVWRQEHVVAAGWTTNIEVLVLHVVDEASTDEAVQGSPQAQPEPAAPEQAASSDGSVSVSVGVSVGLCVGDASCASVGDDVAGAGAGAAVDAPRRVGHPVGRWRLCTPDGALFPEGGEDLRSTVLLLRHTSAGGDDTWFALGVDGEKWWPHAVVPAALRRSGKAVHGQFRGNKSLLVRLAALLGAKSVTSHGDGSAVGALVATTAPTPVLGGSPAVGLLSEPASKDSMLGVFHGASAAVVDHLRWVCGIQDAATGSGGTMRMMVVDTKASTTPHRPAVLSALSPAQRAAFGTRSVVPVPGDGGLLWAARASKCAHLFCMAPPSRKLSNPAQHECSARPHVHCMPDLCGVCNGVRPRRQGSTAGVKRGKYKKEPGKKNKRKRVANPSADSPVAAGPTLPIAVAAGPQPPPPQVLQAAAPHVLPPQALQAPAGLGDDLPDVSPSTMPAMAEILDSPLNIALPSPDSPAPVMLPVVLPPPAAPPNPP